MIKNLYFIIQLPDPALDVILKHCVGTAESQRKSFDGAKTVVKLPVGADIPNVLKNKKVYNHEQILLEMAKPEWSSPDVI